MHVLSFLFTLLTFFGYDGKFSILFLADPTNLISGKEMLDYLNKPNGSHFPGFYSDQKRYILADWLLKGCWSLDGNLPCKSNIGRKVEYEGYDGWYNNIARPDSGAIDRPLLRRWPAAYEDGVYSPSGSKRPNPIELSEKLLKGPIGSKSRTGKNALLVFFGQQVVEEILDAQRPACPPEYFNIDIPEGHKYRTKPGHSVLPLLRTRYDYTTGLSSNNPRQQLNEITPYIDGGLMYGITKQWADTLRTYPNGTVDPDGLLAHSHGELFPAYNTIRLPLANPPPPFYHADYIKKHQTEKVSRFFMLGNPRGNENTFLLTFGILWFRWHNYLAKQLRTQNENWKSEKVFNEARKWVIGTYQHIVLDEWLPSWVNAANKLPKYKYDPSIDPQIDQFFQSAAFRFGHTLVPPGVYIRDYMRNGCTKTETVRTCNAFWRPQEAILKTYENTEVTDIDRVLMGMAVQLCEEEDHKIVEDLRGNVFGPLEFPRRDLMAVNIQRGRDHGLPDFNSARKAFGLPPIKSFSHFKIDTQTMDNLKALYNNSVDDIDVWVGGILETGDGPGELFETIILDQFRRIRDGDRFWFENTENGLFSEDEVKRIKQISLHDVIMAVTKMDVEDIPTNVFRVPLQFGNLEAKCALINSTCENKTAEGSTTSFDCWHLPQLNSETLEPCKEGESYDYFTNSELSFIITFAGVGAFFVGTVGAVFLLIGLKKRKTSILIQQQNDKIRHTFKHDKHIDHPVFTAKEFVGLKSDIRSIVVILNKDLRQISVLTQKGSTLRALDLSHAGNNLTVYVISDDSYVVLRTLQDYDLILQFDTNFVRQHFIQNLDRFLQTIQPKYEIITNLSLKAAMKIVVTKEDRQKKLEEFFRVVFAQAFEIQHDKREILNVDASVAKDVIHTELTINEFAEALKMRPHAEFVVKMFTLIDKDKNGFVSFREFVDLLIIFADGNEERKAQLLFDMYDINKTGYLTPEDFKNMINSFLDTVGGRIKETDLQITIQNMMASAGVSNKEQLTFEDFKKIVGRDIAKLGNAKLGFSQPSEKRENFLDSARDTIENIYESPSDVKARLQGKATSRETSDIIDEAQAQNIKREENMQQKEPKRPGKYVAILRYFEQNSKKLFWLGLYTLVLWGIFIERAYVYSIETEHSGLRRIAGYGVTVTRGAASAMMFTFSSLLVTMCRNSITFLRETVFGCYFPFDSFIEIHKYIAHWGLFFCVIHIVGHAFNFYHISTQTADDLTCLFRNFFHSTHEIPKFHYWCWETITGFTGIIVTFIMILMYVFAQSIVRRHLYNWFWYTHNLYPLFFLFSILHGAGRLIQGPFYYYFFLGPVILFTLDTIVSVSRKKVEIPVLKSEILASDVTTLEFKRPENFNYQSGQWIQIACLGLNANEYHPFTITSSPQDSNLSVHMRAVGPWTRNIRKIYDSTIVCDAPLPKIHIDGPYGEGHQDWYKYSVSVLVGGGIGVTPFASILKDIVFRANTDHKFQCKKVYFIWVSRTQSQFEWLVDILRELEKSDKNQIISNHIFITQFYEKFDLRTILLYICERHYQKISGKSLFTNLSAVTHFGRPSFPQFFKSIQSVHQHAKTVGVFSCGPPTMTRSVDEACVIINKTTLEEPTFKHHYKNF